MHRFYADSESPESGRVYLSPEDAHHALHVLRLKNGDAVELILNGERYHAGLSLEDSGRVSAVLDSLLPDTEPKIRITLFQGIPKGDKMELIIQKAVELGVSTIVPVMMSRCVVRFSDKDAERKMERWQRIAREAGKQSGRCMIPEVCLPCPLYSLADHIAAAGNTVVPWENCIGTGPKTYAFSHPELHSLGIVIGPEGGIADDEIAFLRTQGCEPITLGPRILRTETAGLAAVSAFLALYGEME